MTWHFPDLVLMITEILLEENCFVRLTWYFSQNQKPSLCIVLCSEDGNILTSCEDRYLQQKIHIEWIDFVEVWKYFESSIKNTTEREEKQKELLNNTEQQRTEQQLDHWTTMNNAFEVFNSAGWLLYPLYCQSTCLSAVQNRRIQKQFKKFKIPDLW